MGKRTPVEFIRDERGEILNDWMVDTLDADAPTRLAISREDTVMYEVADALAAYYPIEHGTDGDRYLYLSHEPDGMLFDSITQNFEDEMYRVDSAQGIIEFESGAVLNLITGANLHPDRLRGRQVEGIVYCYHEKHDMGIHTAEIPMLITQDEPVVVFVPREHLDTETLDSLMYRESYVGWDELSE